jgi:hypothetical protein
MQQCRDGPEEKKHNNREAIKPGPSIPQHLIETETLLVNNSRQVYASANNSSESIFPINILCDSADDLRH